MRKTWSVGVVAGALCGAPAWAVQRCTLAGGQVVYQDAACPAAAAASQVRIFTAPSDPAGRQRARAELAAAEAIARRDAVVPAGAAGLTGAAPAGIGGDRPLDGLADACLNLYRPRLRDPRSAYWSNASLDKLDVLSIQVHATNGFGGYVVANVACELRAGRVDRLR